MWETPRVSTLRIQIGCKCNSCFWRQQSTDDKERNSLTCRRRESSKIGVLYSAGPLSFTVGRAENTGCRRRRKMQRRAAAAPSVNRGGRGVSQHLWQPSEATSPRLLSIAMRARVFFNSVFFSAIPSSTSSRNFARTHTG